MCGISAILNSKVSSSQLKTIIEKMNLSISHRGPDAEGCRIFNLTGDGHHECAISALGHRRLSILDLSSLGHQPMSTHDGRYWITYNGEIYNYLELKNELTGKGYHFISQTDTEVILASYQEWGVHCLSRFNGMFAFLIYDRLNHHFFAARDRFGVKPLYYWKSPLGFLALGSEIKQFTTLPGWNSIVNAQMAYDFLNWGVTDHTEQTLFSDVFQLKGGHYLEGKITPTENLHFEIHPWYTLPKEHFKGNYSDAVITFSEILENAVTLRMRSDVPIGSCLSGGLDSSSIVCHINKILRKKEFNINQKTFSAYSEHKKYDEREYVEAVVLHCGVDGYHIIPSTDELERLVPKIVWHQDEPFGSTSIFAQWKVFELASRGHVKVILDGQGADEILAGYHPFHSARFYDLFKAMKWVTLAKEMIHTKRVHKGLNPLLLLGQKILPEVLGQKIKRYLGREGTSPEWLNVKQLGVNDHSPFHNLSKKGVKELSHDYLYKITLPMLLHYEDRDSMAHSVEARTPFLDYRLVEFSYSLPEHYKISNGITKKILRDSTKGTIPEKVRTRMDKMGFVTAEELWFKERKELFQKWISNSIELTNGVISSNALTHFNDVVEGKRPYSFLPWRIMNFGHWLETFSCKIS